jgi:hypothetical protein
VEKYETPVMSSTLFLKILHFLRYDATRMKYARIICYTFYNLFLHVEFSQGPHDTCALVIVNIRLSFTGLYYCKLYHDRVL